MNNPPVPEMPVIKHSKYGKISPVYRAWVEMRQRCYNKNTRQYKDWGGRGINVCEEWLDSFETFFIDMGHAPEGKSLDRINNALGYSKSNCRWATKGEQQQNRRDNKLNPALIDNLKFLRVFYGCTYDELAAHFGICKDHAFNVFNGASWSNTITEEK